MIDLSKLTVKSAREGLKRGDFTSRELTQASIDAIKEKDGEIHALLEVFDDALGQADAADKQIKEGVDLPLLGRASSEFSGPAHHYCGSDCGGQLHRPTNARYRQWVSRTPGPAGNSG